MGGIENVLDSRFKKMHFKNPCAFSSAVAKVKDLMKTTAQNEVKSDSFCDTFPLTFELSLDVSVSS